MPEKAPARQCRIHKSTLKHVLSRNGSGNIRNATEKKNAHQKAFFIGFLIGIVIYSVAANAFGVFTLIPLYIAYKLISNKNSQDTSPKQHTPNA
jgi:hypothetical protein